MDYKNDTKKYFKFSAITLIILFLLFLFNFTIFVCIANADSERVSPSFVYNTAWNLINEKFYFKSKVNLKRWQNKYERKVENINDAHDKIRKLVKTLNDPYTRFLTKEEFKDEEDIIKSTLTGVGIKIANDKPVILDILSESPADKGDIRPNDYLVAVNDTSTRNLKTDQIINLLRGPKDSDISLTLKRKDDIITKTLKREELKIKPVTVKRLNSDIALIKIDTFIPQNTSDIFKEELIQLMSASGIILDLRNNSGGLFKNAIEIADMFLSEGKIVSTTNISGKTNEYANSNRLSDSNVVILVNEYTASASEILASALKENKRAYVIGKKTYGKGLVQEIIELPDKTALHITIAAYFTPSGKNINKKGLVPDEIITSEEKQIKRAEEILLSKEKNRHKATIALL